MSIIKHLTGKISELVCKNAALEAENKILKKELDKKNAFYNGEIENLENEMTNIQYENNEILERLKQVNNVNWVYFSHFKPSIQIIDNLCKALNNCQCESAKNQYIVPGNALNDMMQTTLKSMQNIVDTVQKQFPQQDQPQVHPQQDKVHPQQQQAQPHREAPQDLENKHLKEQLKMLEMLVANKGKGVGGVDDSGLISNDETEYENDYDADGDG